MPQLPLLMSSNDDYPGSVTAGLYVKVPTLPTEKTTVLDIDGGAVFYARLYFDPASHTGAHGAHAGLFVLEVSYRGAYCLTILNPDTALALNTWYWLTFSVGSAGGGFSGLDGHSVYVAACRFVQSGGAGDGPQTNYATPPSPPVGGFHETVNCAVGWGVNLSGTYAPFKNQDGYETFCLGIIAAASDVNNPLSLLAAPTTDPSPSGYTALYLCQEPLGAASTIVDSTSNHYDMAAGPQGAYIVADAAY